MADLWRSVLEIMGKRPSVWLPVLLADLLGFFVNLGKVTLLRSVIRNRLEYHSALGGAPLRGQVTASAMHSATTLALVIDWSSYLIRLLLYACALMATAALVNSFRERLKRPWAEIPAALRSYTGGIFSLSLRALAVYGAAALLFAWLGNLLLNHGHKAWVTRGWLENIVTVCVILTLALVLAPVAVQVLAKRYAPSRLKQQAQTLAVSLGLIAVALGTFIAANMRTVRGGPSVGRTLLELTGSWIVALPYAVLFVGLAVLASEVPVETAEELETPR